MKQEEAPQYRCICTQLTLSGGESISTYGVEMMSCDGIEPFPDVSVDAAEVQRLVDLLRDNAVEPCHFRDVVTDYITR